MTAMSKRIHTKTCSLLCIVDLVLYAVAPFSALNCNQPAALRPGGFAAPLPVQDQIKTASPEPKPVRCRTWANLFLTMPGYPETPRAFAKGARGLVTSVIKGRAPPPHSWFGNEWEGGCVGGHAARDKSSIQANEDRMVHPQNPEDARKQRLERPSPFHSRSKAGPSTSRPARLVRRGGGVGTGRRALRSG